MLTTLIYCVHVHRLTKASFMIAVYVAFFAISPQLFEISAENYETLMGPSADRTVRFRFESVHRLGETYATIIAGHGQQQP